MLAKVLMCECFYQIFESEGDSYEKKYLFFHCKCKKKKHVLYVLFGDWHPYGSDSNQEMSGQKCTCAVLTYDEICGYKQYNYFNIISFFLFFSIVAFQSFQVVYMVLNDKHL